MAESNLEVVQSSHSKLKTQGKPSTLRHIRADIINSVRVYLQSGARVSFGRPIKLPLIRRQTNEIDALLDQCSSSRISHNNNSQLCMREQAKQQATMLDQSLIVRDSSFGRALVNRSRVFRRLKETNSELTKPSGCELSLKTQEYEEKSMPKPALPKIIRTKYFREQEQMERIKSERNVNKLEVIRGINRYEMGCVIGRGSYSVVRAAKSDDGKSFAIKTYGKTKLTDSDKRQNVRREVEILGRISHPNLISFVEAIETAKSINIVTELVDSPSLQAALARTENSRMTEIEAKPLFKQLIEAVSYLHSRNICHRDIKIDNILLTAEQVVKLIDFGFSIESDGKLDSFCGTPSYIAPQVISKGGYYGRPADIWSCGIVLFKLLCGNYPFRGINEAHLYNKIVRGKFKLIWPLSDEARDLLKCLLKVEPADRPNAEQLLLHPWLSHI